MSLLIERAIEEYLIWGRVLGFWRSLKHHSKVHSEGMCNISVQCKCEYQYVKSCKFIFCTTLLIHITFMYRYWYLVICEYFIQDHTCHPCAQLIKILKMRHFWFLNLPSTRDWAQFLNQSGARKKISRSLIGLNLLPSHVYLVNWEIRIDAFWECRRKGVQSVI